jgi:hypothetical protein
MGKKLFKSSKFATCNLIASDRDMQQVLQKIWKKRGRSIFFSFSNTHLLLGMNKSTL